MNLVTICPPEPNESGLTKTQGTRIVLSDGSELHGITKIVLTADLNDIWRAEVACHFKASELPNVLAQIEATAIPEGVMAEATTFVDEAHRCEP